MRLLILTMYIMTMFRLGYDHSKHDPNYQGSSGGCYIATYVYGTDSEEVKRLKKFRDEFLLTFDEGRHFVWTYYMISPQLIEWHKTWKGETK